MAEDILENQLFEIIENEDMLDNIKLAKIEMLITLGVNVDAREKFNYRTALMVASWEGNKDIVKMLIDNGASLDVRDGRLGDSALTLASKRGNKEVVELLLLSGADINLTNDKGQNALNAAKDEETKNVIFDVIKKMPSIKLDDEKKRMEKAIIEKIRKQEDKESMKDAKEIEKLIFSRGRF